jgi:hypothetical protein
VAEVFFSNSIHLIKTFGGWAEQQLPDGTVSVA